MSLNSALGENDTISQDVLITAVNILLTASSPPTLCYQFENHMEHIYVDGFALVTTASFQMSGTFLNNAGWNTKDKHSTRPTRLG